MSKRQVLSVDRLVEGVKLSLDNATSLLADARVLQAAARYPRALALAILAMEELGKLRLLVAYDRFVREGRESEWWEGLHSHGPKQQQFLLGRILRVRDRDPILDLVNSSLHAKAIHELKMKALYVDWNGAEFGEPNGIEDLADKTNAYITDVDDSLERTRASVSGLTAEKLQNIRQHQSQLMTVSDDEEALEAYLVQAQSHGMEATTAHAIREISRMKRAFAHYRQSQG